MTKQEKEEVKSVKKLIKNIKKGFGGPCPELNIECGTCKATVLIAHLEWYVDLIEWSGEVKKIKQNGTKK